jgi:hypothetical protein
VLADPTNGDTPAKVAESLCLLGGGERLASKVASLTRHDAFLATHRSPKGRKR